MAKNVRALIYNLQCLKDGDTDLLSNVNEFTTGVNIRDYGVIPTGRISNEITYFRNYLTKAKFIKSKGKKIPPILGRMKLPKSATGYYFMEPGMDSKLSTTIRGLCKIFTNLTICPSSITSDDLKFSCLCRNSVKGFKVKDIESSLFGEILYCADSPSVYVNALQSILNDEASSMDLLAYTERYNEFLEEYKELKNLISRTVEFVGKSESEPQFSENILETLYFLDVLVEYQAYMRVGICAKVMAYGNLTVENGIVNLVKGKPDVSVLLSKVQDVGHNPSFPKAFVEVDRNWNIAETSDIIPDDYVSEDSDPFDDDHFNYLKQNNLVGQDDTESQEPTTSQITSYH